MAQTKQVLDGTMPVGSRAITINGVVYKLNKLTVTPAAERGSDNNPDGSPNRVRSVQGVKNWSAECQLATASTGRPKPGDTFTATYDSTIGSETYVVELVPHEEDNSPTGIRVLNISGWVALNPGSITVS